MQFLTISGSLRAASSNTVLLRALAALAPSDIEVVPCELIGTLPFFNPDLDGEIPPARNSLNFEAIVEDDRVVKALQEVVLALRDAVDSRPPVA